MEKRNGERKAAGNTAVNKWKAVRVPPDGNGGFSLPFAPTEDQAACVKGMVFGFILFDHKSKRYSWEFAYGPREVARYDGNCEFGVSRDSRKEVAEELLMLADRAGIKIPSLANYVATALLRERKLG